MELSCEWCGYRYETDQQEAQNLCGACLTERDYCPTCDEIAEWTEQDTCKKCDFLWKAA